MTMPSAMPLPPLLLPPGTVSRHRFSPYWLLMLAGLLQGVRAEEEVSFDPALLHLPAAGEQGHLDVDRYRRGNPLTAGSYPSDIMLNQAVITHQTVTLRRLADDNIEPCLTAPLLQRLGYLTDTLSATQQRALASGACLPDLAHTAGLHWHYAMESLTLAFEIEPDHLRHQIRGAIDPADWQTGSTVAFVRYNLFHYVSQSGVSQSGVSQNAASQQSSFADLDNGINLGAWRLRNRSVATRMQQQNHLHSLQTYAERSLPDWTARLRLGQNWSDGRLFDGIAYNGIELASDERMLPASQRGFAPQIRGVARSYAKVTIRQHGSVIYETAVAPGHFVIDDLYPTTYGGDLTVIITEADHSQHQFQVPFAAVPGMVRPGQWLFSATAGRTRPVSWADHGAAASPFAQGQLYYGLNNHLSLFGGVTALPDYQAGVSGINLNTSLGAISLDATRSQLARNSPHEQGMSYRATYSTRLSATDTRLTLASYRYSSKHYRSLNEAVNGSLMQGDAHPHQRFDMTLSQPLGSGSLYLMGSHQTYWHNQHAATSWQLGYNNQLGLISYHLAGEHLRSDSGQAENQIALELSLPLGDNASHSLSLQTVASNRNGAQERVELGGSVGDTRALSYGIQANRQVQDHQAQQGIGANLAYRSPRTSLSGSASHSSGHQRQYSLGISGGLVVHDGQLDAVPELGETFAILHAEGAEGANLRSQSGVAIGQDGYAIVPQLAPYTAVELALDQASINPATELLGNSQWVVADAGAAVRVEYPTRHGQSVLMQLTDSQGHALPFGTSVHNEQGEEVGLIGQGGQLYARLARARGTLSAAQGDATCHTAYQLPATDGRLLQLATPLRCQ